MISDQRQLKDLEGVGPATIADLYLLGVRTVRALATQDGEALYDKLCVITGVQHDPCCLDVFRCAVAQAKDIDLPRQEKKWWYWTAQRKQEQTTR